MDACTKYAQDVVAGSVPATDSIRLACERHLGDLEDGHKRGLHFDVDASELPAEFFRSLRHTIGEWAGQPIVLQPWQNFVLGSLWGWQRKDGFRRFRTSYFEVPRKNGKSTIAAGGWPSCGRSSMTSPARTSSPRPRPRTRPTWCSPSAWRYGGARRCCGDGG